MLARLTVYHPERPTQQYYLDRQTEYFVGRDSRCALYFEDRRLSRRHAVIQNTGSGFELSDLGSKNGTFVSGHRISRHALDCQTWIEFGGLLCRFELVSGERRASDDDKASRRWDTSIALSREFRPDDSLPALAARVLQSVIDIAAAERGFIMLCRDSGEYHIEASQPADALRFEGSSTVVARTIDGGVPVVCCNVSVDAALADQASIVSGGISALACVPLNVGNRAIGVVYVDSSKPGHSYTQLDIEIMQALASHAALVIGATRIRDDIVDLQARLPTEMARGVEPDAALIRRIHSQLPDVRSPDKVVFGTDGIEIT